MTGGAVVVGVEGPLVMGTPLSMVGGVPRRVTPEVVAVLSEASLAAGVGVSAMDVIVSVACATLPAASCAMIVMTLMPGRRETESTRQSVVPLAIPATPRSLAQVTRMTSPIAVPLTATGPWAAP